MKLRRLFGPSTLITAAFIGPGTLNTCTRAGINHGCDLLWALVFAGFATVVLQEMAARLGWVTQAGLGEAIRSEFAKSNWKAPVFALVICAIVVGNAAYEGGNLSGAVVGMQLLRGGHQFAPLVIGAACLALLWFGKNQLLERLLIAIVIGMSLCFLLTAAIVQPDLTEVMRGLRPQSINSDNLMTILALIGTTIVPYNLFLHASMVSRKWSKDDSLTDLRLETIVAVVLGIAISVLIMVTSAATRQHSAGEVDVDSVEALATQLKPLAAGSASILMGVGYFAAGLSSALTAPLAAAYAARGLFGWAPEARDRRFVSIWLLVLVVGISVAQSGFRPRSIILVAQIANALILPAIGVFLFRLANSRQLMGTHANGWKSNLAGAAVLLILLALCGRTLFGMLQ